MGQDTESSPPLYAELNLEDVTSLEDLVARLDALRDAGTRVVVLGGVPAWETNAAGLRALELSVLPTIFAFDGELSGTAAEVALHCDIRVCGASASFVAGAPGSRRLLRLIGEEGTVTVIRSGGRLDATAALATGLVSEVAEAGIVLDAARRLAAVIASRGPIATQLAKEAIWRGLEMPLAQALRFETDLTLLLQTTKDRAEGVAAFLEKRPPRFTGE